MTVFEKLMAVRRKRGGGFLLLIDPDRLPRSEIIDLVESGGACGVDAFLVGSSLTLFARFHETVEDIKTHTGLPVIIFPGAHSQISPAADAILFTSMISSRNPNYLIDEQVKGAPLVREYGLEPISTGYMLIDCGTYSSVQYISGSFPIPSDKSDIACAHALAAQYMGMKLIFMEGGSGAQYSVPAAMIRAVADYISLPLMVGGGIKRPEEAEEKIESGASFVVIGNRIETRHDSMFLREFAEAIHPLEKVSI